MSGFAIGDTAIGLSDWFANQIGIQAEYVVLPAAALATPPADVSLVAASTLPLNAQTALQALDQLELSAGDTLAVTGAAGAVGGYAVQLAASRGASSRSPARRTSSSYVTSAPNGSWPAPTIWPVPCAPSCPGGVDEVFDPALLGAPALAAARDGGTYLNAASPLAPAPERDITTGGVAVHSDGRQLAELVRLVEQGVLTLRVAETYALEDAATVHGPLAKGGVRGRLVYVP